jgi:YD repeat-containing protein
VTYSYTYDNTHRVSTLNDNRGNKTLSYFYSNAGLLLTMQDGDGNRTDYEYDPTGRLTGIWAPNNDYTAFAYDDAGRLIEKWFPNGVNTQYIYNRDNTLKQLINRHGAGITISQHDYTYDPVGNRASHTELINGTTNPYSYAYDALNRLTSVTNTNTSTTESYAYDPLGNRNTKTAGGTTLAYVYDNANQLTEIHTGSIAGTLVGGLVYDNNGNLTKKCESGTVTVSPTTCMGNTVTDLTHDAFNRLGKLPRAA